MAWGGKNMAGLTQRGADECVLIPWLSDHLQHCPAVWLCLPFAYLPVVSSPLAEVPARAILSISLCFTPQLQAPNGH